LECKNWIPAEGLVYLNQKELDVKPELRWLESIEGDLKNVRVRNWRRE